MAKRNGIIIKTPEEIEGIRRSARLAASVLTMIEPYVRVGISTEELDTICNAYIIANGGISACIGYGSPYDFGYPKYPKYTCISINDVICHGIPSSDTYIADGDIVNIDVTTIVDGYFGDTSRTYLVGNVSDRARKLVDVTRKSLDIGISQVRPGMKTGNIGYAIAQYVESQGFSVVREYTGHGVGIAFHEEPWIYHKAQRNSGIPIQTGMIFTIEPMVNIGGHRTKLLDDGWTVKTLDGSLSAQFEHTILVTENGYEVLSVA